MYHLQFPIILGRAERALVRLRRELFKDSKPLQLEYAVTEEHLSFAAKDQLCYQPVPSANGEFCWGRSDALVWRSAWFCARADVSSEIAHWQSQKPDCEIALDLSFSGEGLVFDSNGKAIQGISGGSVLHQNFQRSLVMNAGQLLQDGKLEIWIEAAANTLFGLERDDDPRAGAPRYYGEHLGKLYSAQIVLLDKALWQYLLDLESATQQAQNLLHSKAAGSWGAGAGETGKTASPRAKRLIYAIDKSLNLSARGLLLEAQQLLHRTFINGNAPSDLATVAVGHAHIDTGWLWPVQETVRKCARTFANQLRLMEQYPSYIFGASQAQHYLFVKEYYPEIYQKIQQRVAEGRWEIQGAMWVEADANIPSGESFVRQLLHGKNFFRDEFGVDVQNLWLPDVFGYSANLPQILQRAGVPYFLTQKLSWSQYNDFPHHTFHWQGVDGSSVLTHFPPEATYNSTLTLGGIHGLGLSAAQNGFKEAHLLDEFMTLFGVGDGGGGPDESMIERGLRLAKGVEAAPKVQFGRADEFFERLEGKADLLARWNGELYLELHRGTLTSQARTKRGNRQLEQALRKVEYLYSLSDAVGKYPQPQLEKLWQTLLLNQFHDIIPGSSICEVYKRTEREHQEALQQCEELIQHWGQSELVEAEQVTLINHYSLPLQMLVPLPKNWEGAQSSNDACQILATEGASGSALSLIRLAPQAIASLRSGPLRPISGSIIEPARLHRQEGHFILENGLVRYTFRAGGQLCEAWDKELERPILSSASGCKGLGNRLRLYSDWPRDWDAWEIDINYQAEMLAELEAHEASELSQGQLCAQLCFYYACGRSSQIEQTVSLEAGSKRLSFANQVNWYEKHRMLRVSFEPQLDSGQSQHASYDIQYAYLERPNHRNTSWEMAQFEVVGQRYADLSGPDYGVSLLNDCKYGYQIVGNWIDLNLLRSATLPDPDADQGQHCFSYALLPHRGSLQQAMPQIQAEAALLNCGPLIFEGRKTGELGNGLPNLELPLQIDSDNVTLEVLKKAEKSEDLILRLVERVGSQSLATLTWPAKFSGLQECDIIEWNDTGEVLASGCKLLFKPFAIRTFRLRRTP